MRLKNSLRILLFSASIACSISLHGQSQASTKYPSVNITSPTAAGLGKYVDFPVNLHSGIPEIGIPIYTVQEGPLQLPISLSYHASGLKVMEPATWVGAGWSLNVGGVISRTVKGLPDDKRSIQTSNSFFIDEGFSNYYVTPNGVADYNWIAQGAKDGEPDLFTFNFGSYSGKFYFREDQTPLFIPDIDLKIDTLLSPTSDHNYIKGFIITDPEGVRYHFGVTPDELDVDPIEKSAVKVPGGLIATLPTVVSSWYLHKIESADREFEINISYRKEDYSFMTISTQPCIPNCDGKVQEVKVIVSGVSPERIEFSNGTVDFFASKVREDLGKYSFVEADELNDDARSLDSIKIKSFDAEHCKLYRFDYGYFSDNSPEPLPYQIAQHGVVYNTDRKRLKLNSVQELSCDSSASKPPHRFYYYDEEKVPRRLSFAQDHWGYFNGATANSTFIPPVSGNGGQNFMSGDNKEAAWPSMRAGALRLITYPTGGGTEYIYESNSATVTGKCSYQQSPNLLTTLTAGMGNASAEMSAPFILQVDTVSLFAYNVTAQGFSSGVGPFADGNLYINNSPVTYVHSHDKPNSFGYFSLRPGTYTLQVNAGADNGSGQGVLAYLYNATANCTDSWERLVGGLRIRSIQKFGTGDSPKTSMTYEYSNANLYSIPTYIFKLKHPLFRTNIVSSATQPENGCYVDASGSQKVYWSPTSTHPMQTIQGYHIGYQKVTERFPDGGYIIHQYKGNFDLPSSWYTLEDVCVRDVEGNVCNPGDPVLPVPPNQFDFDRGKLDSQRFFDKNNKKVKEILYSYSYTEDKVGVFGLATAHSGINDLYLPTHYNIRSGKLNWTKQLEKVYDNSGNAIEQESLTSFSSAYHSMPTSETRTTQNGVQDVRYVYVPDLTKCKVECPSCASDYLTAIDSISSYYRELDLRCRNNVCETSWFLGQDMTQMPCSRHPTSNALMQCKTGAYRDLEFRLNAARVAYTNCITACSRNNTCTVQGIASTNHEVKTLYLMELGNVLKLIEASSWKDGIFQSSTLLDYKADLNDQNKIYLKNGFATEVATPVTTFAPAHINASKVIQRDVKYNSNPVVTYLFSGGQPVEIKNRNGSTTSYIWGFNNTLPVVQAVGVDYTTLQAATASSNLRTTVYGSAPRAQITEYNYKPLIGITSVTDVNGRTLYYEYDKLGRLIRIKDHDGKVLEQTEYTYQLD